MSKLWRDLEEGERILRTDEYMLKTNFKWTSPPTSVGKLYTSNHLPMRRRVNDIALSDDPLTALKSVMIKHNMSIDTIGGMTI